MATAPMSARQIRRVVLAGSLALPLSGVLLWTSISPVSASSQAPVMLATTGSVATTTTTPIAATTSAPHRTAPVKARRSASVTSSKRHSSLRARTVLTTVASTTTTIPTTSKPKTPTTAADQTTSTVATTTPTTTTTVAPTTTTTAPPAVAYRLTNPAANIAPNPNFLSSGPCTKNSNGTYSCANPCVTSQLTWPTLSNDPACTTYVLQAINVARADEGLASMVLPTNWYTLSTTQQLFVLADLERTARGMPAYLGLNGALSATAQRAAAANSDPGLASGFPIANNAQGVPAMGAAWAGGFMPLIADYIWMYDDGWGGSAAATSNIACTSPRAAGCWAHRDELLGSDPGYNPGVGLATANCEMGTGYAVVNGSSSFVDLIEVPSGSLPPMTFTWKQELAAGY